MQLPGLFPGIRCALIGMGLPLAAMSVGLAAEAPGDHSHPGGKPPAAEPVALTRLPLPPTAPSDRKGSCDLTVNTRGTGCISASDHGIQEGPAYMWDNRHVLLTIVFAGAPAAPNPASVFDGPQVVAIRTDGTAFPNGDLWKCLTCGVPDENRKGTVTSDDPMADSGLTAGRPARAPSIRLDHPQAFPDGKRALAGPNIIDCGPFDLTSPQCTPERVHIYPIRWGRSRDGSGKGAVFREQRLNPDGVHINWNAFAPSTDGIEQFGYLGRLVFNPAPKSGEPRVPRYDLENVYLLINNRDPAFQRFAVDPKRPDRLIHNPPRGEIGEMRGWTRDGRRVIGMGFAEAGNADLFITDLDRGASHRLTRDPAYTDPMMMSPDDRWFVAMDNRTTDRHMYYAGMQGVPPLLDMLTLGVAVCCYNNGNRRFFQPFLIDAEGDRGSYRGQQLNGGDGAPGSYSDPNWNGRADPAWSPDGTRIVYWQALVTAPACGGRNPLACPTSNEPGGRRTRLIMATLTGREPQRTRRIAAKPINVGWGIRLRPGDPLPHRRPGPAAGSYVLEGRRGGKAEVMIERLDGAISAIHVRYSDFTDDGRHIINGSESASREGTGLDARTVWHSDLRSSGLQTGTKKTGPEGLTFTFHGPVQGDLVTTIDGKEYRRPPPGT